MGRPFFTTRSSRRKPTHVVVVSASRTNVTDMIEQWEILSPMSLPGARRRHMDAFQGALRARGSNAGIGCRKRIGARRWLICRRTRQVLRKDKGHGMRCWSKRVHGSTDSVLARPTPMYVPTCRPSARHLSCRRCYFSRVQTAASCDACVRAFCCTCD